MKKDWTYKKLGEVGSIITGNTPSTKDVENYSSNDVCFFKPSDIETTSITLLNKSEYYISEYAYKKARKLPKDTVLTTCIGIIGKVGILAQDSTCNQQINAIIPNTDVVLPRYLAYAIFSLRHILQETANAPVVPLLNKTQFSNFTIPIPPISIQESIVRELDAIHGILEKKLEQLRELDNLAQAIFYELFGDPITNPMGWEIKKLGEVALEKLSYGSGASAIDFDNEVRYVRITDINDDGSLNENAVSPSVCEDKYLLHCGDILFARTGATVGKTYLHLESAIKCIYAGYLIRFIPNKEIINPLYAFHFTKTRYYHDFVAQSQRAVAQPNINAQQYSNLSLPLPPLSLQQSFAAKVSAIEAQKQAITQSIHHTEALLAQRMDQYFA